MHRISRLGAIAAAAAMGTLGCNNFLTGPDLSTNPNFPTASSPELLFTGIQSGTWGNFETFPALLIQTWAQHVNGVDRQWVGYSQYNTTVWQQPPTFDVMWNSFYSNGGLKDIRAMNDGFVKDTEPVGVGIAQFYEGWLMGTAADIWGDVPYSQALANPIPAGGIPFDAQADVYAHVQLVLDSAIANLTNPGGRAFTGSDLSSLAGNGAAYAAAAHTLKARFFMHTSAYANALAEATLGIADTSGDFLGLHNGTAGSSNLTWGSIGVGGDRNADLRSSKQYIELAKRIGALQTLAANETPVDSGSNANAFVGTIIGAPNPPAGAKALSDLAIGPSSPSTWVSYAENQLILAEAQARLGQGAPVATLNAVRATYNEAPVGAVAGNVLLQAILSEKYVHEFLQFEPFFDYMRTCWPNLQLPTVVAPFVPFIPGRFYIGQSEFTTNPSAPAQGNANANNPKHATSLDGTACAGQVNRPGP